MYGTTVIVLLSSGSPRQLTVVKDNALGYFLVGPREPLLAHDVEVRDLSYLLILLKGLGGLGIERCRG